jgi:LuxR family maltose regulon positive regulatory protein
LVELLATKLFIPRPRANLVPRPRLTERLNAGLGRKLTLIAAPAGFGKTTLLSEWIPTSPRCVTWLALDEGDNDPTKFWTYMIASLQELRSDLGAGALSLLQSPQAPPITSILTSLINDLSAFPEAFAIVLDDYHVIDFEPIHEALAFLLAHLPANMHLVLTTRVDPPLPLARLRGRDRLTELRVNDLRFSAEEAAAFLRNVMGLDLSGEEVAALEARTEGWIAGLQIAALSMQDREDISGFIQAFSGSHRHILGYLAEEVLNQQPGDTLDFLLQTSILDRLCGPLCEAVTGNTDGQAMLESLEHVNLFITPLDDEGIWYRYHHLFAEVLQARLQQNQPELLVELHGRACNWYTHQGMLEEAVRHALAGAEFEEAAQLIVRIAPANIYRGEIKTLIAWMDRLPDEHVFNNGELVAYECWLLYLSGQVGLAKEYAEMVWPYVPGDTSSVARGRMAFLNSQFAIIREDIPAAIEYVVEALDLIGEEDLFFRSLALATLSGTQILIGNPGNAIDNLREAARIGEKFGQPLATLSAYIKLADQLNYHGNLQEGRAICDYAMHLYVDSSGQPSPISGLAYIAGAKLAYEENDLDVLHQYLSVASTQEELLGMAGLTLEVMVIQTLFEQARGDINAALARARQGSSIAEKTGIKGYFTHFAALEANLYLKIGNFQAVENWVETSHISSIRDDDLYHLEENIVFARCLIMQNRWSAASELLEGLERTVIRAEYTRYLIVILILKALLFQRQQYAGQAIENLEQALRLAAPQGYRRVFLDEGEPMRRLLVDYRSHLSQPIKDGAVSESIHLLAYTDKLLAAFSPAAPAGKPELEAALEPLSERELDILRLIAEGYTNQEIAETLVIAVSTVKSHINHLYGKLGIQRRTQAVAMARGLGLLAD